MQRHILGWLLALVWLSACGTTVEAGSDASGSGDAVSAVVGLPCSQTAATCEGNDVVTCDNGSTVHSPCGTDAYCNYGACVPTTIVLPRDAAAHTERSEWWYYTGHLNSGKQVWGFEVCIFQYDMSVLLQSPGLGFMCHVAVVDKTAGEHYHVDSVALDATTWTAVPIVLDVANCRLELGGDGHDHIRGQIPAGMEKDHKASPWLIDLTLTPQKRVARHGGDGIIPMSAGKGSSWYYSYTKLAATGQLQTPTGTFDVTGQAWMDHQWGGFDITDFKGWDWWSLQFVDGYEIMLFQFTDWEGKLASQAGTIVDPAGNTSELDGFGDFSVKGLRKWPSPHTDGIYPLDWDISIAKMSWQIAVRTSVDDQEMYNIAQNYWEGETTLSGTRGTTPVTGVGYTELTGYATDAMDPVKP